MARTVTRPALVGLRCRTSDRTPHSSRGAEALAGALGRRLGIEPRLIGRLEEVRKQAYEADLAGSRGCLLEAGGQVDDAFEAGALPILVAGDCSIALTTLPTVARRRPDARVLWLDAHGDFHTPSTTESRYLGGMALAGACGLWDSGFPGRVPDDRLVLCGVRDLDDGERTLLERSAAVVIGPERALVYAPEALDGEPVYVHLDLDVVDPHIVPAQFPAAGGLTDARLRELLETVAAHDEIVGVEVCGFELPDDPDAEATLVELVAAALEPLLPGGADGVR